MVAFKDLRFGYASAEVEGAREPDLLLLGYYDKTGVIEQAVRGNRYLFLGYKGSGKTAIGERLRLLANNDPLLFVTSNFLSDFPYNSFSKVASGDVEPESRLPTAWAWLLLLRLVDSFRRDAGANIQQDPATERSLQQLERLGLLPIADLKQLVLTSSKASFKAKVPQLLEVVTDVQFQSQDVALVQLVHYLKGLVKSFRSASRHVLVIDGLDDILTHRDIQYQSLAALMLEVSRLNDEFARENVPAKIVVLCRTDLFEILPGANKNKIRRDSAVVLDWYHDTRDPEQSALLEMLNLRAGITTGSETNVVAKFFPSRIDGAPALRTLLDLTRHTPRDVIQLMDSIQRFASTGPLSRDQILSGMRHYSIDYLLPEIKDELVGSASASEIESILSLISSLRSREFRYGTLVAAARSSGSGVAETLDVEKMLHALYECSAVGNVQERAGYHAYSFKFRSRNTSVALNQPLMLHKGIWKAMNLI